MAATPGHVARAWEFFRSIGSPKYIVAPMVNASELAFRMLARKYGAELAVTPMFFSRRFAVDRKLVKMHHQVAPGGVDRPLLAQFCGDDPETMLAGAKTVEATVDGVDINLGCPQGIARKGHYGAFLLEETELVVSIVETMVAGLSVPVTCKIRVLEAGVDATIALAQRLQAAGCSMLTVHGRTRVEIGPNIGAPDWDAIAAVKAAVDIPVIANGGIEHFADIARCMAATGVDGVMVSEGILERPDIFSNPGPLCAATQDRLVREYLDLCKTYPPPLLKMPRTHLFKMLHFSMLTRPELRPLLGKARSLEEIDAFAAHVASLHAAHEYDCDLSPAECPQLHSAVNSSWYRRHRTADGSTMSAEERKARKQAKSVRTARRTLKAARKADAARKRRLREEQYGAPAAKRQRPLADRDTDAPPPAPPADAATAPAPSSSPASAPAPPAAPASTPPHTPAVVE